VVGEVFVEVDMVMGEVVGSVGDEDEGCNCGTGEDGGEDDVEDGDVEIGEVFAVPWCGCGCGCGCCGC